MIMEHQSKQFDNSVKQELEPVAALKGHTLGVDAVAFNPTLSTEMMTAGHDELLNLWDLQKNEVVFSTKLQR